MSATEETTNCNKKCWMTAAGVGALIGLLMLIGGYSFLSSAFVGVVAAVLIGLLLTWLICTPQERMRTTVPTDPDTSSLGAAASAADVDAAKQRAAAEETARAQADAEAAEKKRAEDAAAAKTRADADAKTKAAAAATAKKATPQKADPGPDYDGDGVLEGADEGARPAALDGPRGGTADDLKKIKGVGPKLEQLLNSLGFYHFDQISGWSAHEVAWMDANLKGFKGRVSRDNWVEQARLLATGGETEFSKKVDKGGVY